MMRWGGLGLGKLGSGWGATPEEEELGPIEEVAIRLLIRIYVYGLGFLDVWFRDYASA